MVKSGSESLQTKKTIALMPTIGVAKRPERSMYMYNYTYRGNEPTPQVLSSSDVKKSHELAERQEQKSKIQR